MNLSLSVIPLLEVVSFELLMSGVEFLQVDHFTHEFSLSKTFINEQIVFFVNDSVTSGAYTREYFVSSSQSGRVVSLKSLVMRPIHVSVHCSDRVDLFFIPFDTVWRSNVISEQP